MTKQQIIAPLVAMALVAALFLYRHARLHERERLLAVTYALGRELTQATNSQNVAPMGPALRQALLEFLAAPAHPRSVRLETPIEGKPRTRLRLVNDNHDELEIEFEWDSHLQKFNAIGYWHPALPELPPPR